MWRLSRLELEDFRAYSGRHSVSFEDFTVLYGRIGAGKTSLLYAVEFALFGRQMEVRERIARLVDLVNSSAQSARVVVELRGSEGDRLIVSRSLTRRGHERLEVRYGGRAYEGKAAERLLEELLGADEDLYERLVYISHRSLEGLVYGTAQRRALALDRLFGLEEVDAVVRAVSSARRALLQMAEEVNMRLAAYERHRDLIRRYGSVKALAERQRALAREVEELRSREDELARTLEELAKRRAVHMEALKASEGLVMEYFRVRSELEFLEGEGEGGAVEVARVEQLRDVLMQVLEEFEHVVGRDLLDRLSKPGSMEELAGALAEAYDALARLHRDMEAQREDLDRQVSATSARLSRLEAELASLEARRRHLERLYQRYKELEGQSGPLEAARARLAQLRERIGRLEGELSLASALKVLASHSLEVGAHSCPLCGSSLDLDRLRGLLAALEERHGGVMRELEEARREAAALEAAVREMEEIAPYIAEYVAARDKAAALEAERRGLQDLLAQSEKAARQLERRLERLRQLLSGIDKREIQEAVRRYSRTLRARELRRRLKELEEALRRAGVVEEALLLESRWRATLEELERVSQRLRSAVEEKAKLEEVASQVGEEADLLRSRLETLRHLLGRLEALEEGLERAKASARARLAAEVGTELKRAFRSLYRYGDIVDVEASVGAGEGLYEFQAVSPSGERFGISRLSDGQRLSLALALAIALRRLSRMRIGFMAFDEPIPYVDASVRAAFVELARELAKEYQVILATQSAEFARALAEAVPGAVMLEIRREGEGAPTVGPLRT